MAGINEGPQDPMRDPRHDVLFAPLPIGPKTARNRFYQVPHCNGMGHREPQALAALRGAKAEGGWAVVCTEEVEIHPSSEVSPSIEGRLWSEADIPAHVLVTAAIHEHGSLAGVELVYNAPRANLVSRLPAMGVRAGPVASEWLEPTQCRAMDLADIAAVRRWHAAAARRARTAGYDLIYVYAGHSLALAQTFLSRAHNDRTDAYGGSLVNRVRFLKELIEATREAIGPDCALPVRLAVEEGQHAEGLSRAEIEDVVGMLDPLVDLWDFCMGSWEHDSRTARFAEEGFQNEYVQGLKRIAAKPVVGVGRFTSPDAMAAQVRSGALDFIGAARPSIADPFLPNKIAAGAYEDLRECIGCNICVAGDNQSVPLRCTQNPTIGEEWRKGWSAERTPARTSARRVLIVGAGPAGLEAAMTLARRGYETALADGRDVLGGRVVREAGLPGLRAWGRVADYRIGQLRKLPAAQIYPASTMTAEDVLAFGAARVALATGARWRRDGVGRSRAAPLPVAPDARILTPDDLFDGAAVAGAVVVYDDDHYALGGAIAELLARGGAQVTLATPAPLVSYWTQLTLEQAAIEARLVQAGVHILTRAEPEAISSTGFAYRCGVTQARHELACDAAVIVAGRTANDDLAHALAARRGDWGPAGLEGVDLIGDALAPAMIVHAVYAGHAYARAFDEPIDPDAVGFKRALPQLTDAHQG